MKGQSCPNKHFKPLGIDVDNELSQRELGRLFWNVAANKLKIKLRTDEKKDNAIIIW